MSDPDQDPLFFGYGSLVNLATHSYAQPAPARLSGWRRVWRGTALRPAAFLSVMASPGDVIAGITARVPGADWAALDAREAAYARRDVSHQVAPTGPAPVAVYEVESQHMAPEDAHPILLSYLDVVVQGYLRVFGHAEAARFFETTDGWSRGITDDRTAPLYPPAQVLSVEERAFVDDWLARVL